MGDQKLYQQSKDNAQQHFNKISHKDSSIDPIKIAKYQVI
jgi:hypothetical protein